MYFGHLLIIKYLQWCTLRSILKLAQFSKNDRPLAIRTIKIVTVKNLIFIRVVIFMNQERFCCFTNVASVWLDITITAPLSKQSTVNG